jgi:hypothetical protein
MEKIGNNETSKLVKIICVITLIILIISFTNMYTTIQKDITEGFYWTQRAVADNNPEWCDAISNLKYEVECYDYFVKEGFECSQNEESKDSSACLIAYAIYQQDELLCDEYFPPEELPLNLECRVTLFIERYTNEGISDCCHI